jgi:hypothetical protein
MGTVLLAVKDTSACAYADRWDTTTREVDVGKLRNEEMGRIEPLSVSTHGHVADEGSVDIDAARALDIGERFVWIMRRFS